MLKASAWWMILGPLYNEISSKSVYGYVQEDQELMKYFPDYLENIIPGRTFFYIILSTIIKVDLKE